MGKIQPFKAITNTLKGVVQSPVNILSGKGNLGDFLSVAGMFAPGGNLLADPSKWGSANLLGNLKTTALSGLAGNLMGGGYGGPRGIPQQVGGSGFGSNMDPLLREILMKQYGLADQGAGHILDFAGRAGDYRTNALFGGARAAESTGAQIAQQTGNDFMRSAVALGNQNQANEQANQFQNYLFGPQGQSEAYQAAQGLYNAPFSSGMGIANLGLQREQLHNQRVATNKQFAKPSFIESLGTGLLGASPYIIQNWGSIFGRPQRAPYQNPVNTNSPGYRNS